MSFETLYLLGNYSTKIDENSFPQGIEKKLIITKNDECVGELTREFKRENQNTEMILNANLAVEGSYTPDDMSQDNRIGQKLNILLHSAFNPLNQMVATALRIKIGTYEIVLALLNVNPVEFSINSIGDQNKLLKKKFSIPGPFILNNIGEELQIQHRPSGKSVPLDIAPLIFNFLNLKIESGELKI